jgi:hypothetical protein
MHIPVVTTRRSGIVAARAVPTIIAGIFVLQGRLASLKDLVRRLISTYTVTYPPRYESKLTSKSSPSQGLHDEPGKHVCTANTTSAASYGKRQAG